MFPQLEEKLQALKQALNTATSENIIEQCKQHLHFLPNTESNSTNCRTSREYVKSKRLLRLGFFVSRSSSTTRAVAPATDLLRKMSSLSKDIERLRLFC